MEWIWCSKSLVGWDMQQNLKACMCDLPGTSVSAIPGGPWRKLAPPAAYFTSNKLVLLHEAFHEPWGNMEMLVDSAKFCQLSWGHKDAKFDSRYRFLGGGLFVWWWISWPGVQKTEFFSLFCNYELVSWTHGSLLINVLLEHICTCCRAWELLLISPHSLGTPLEDCILSSFHPEWPVRCKM